MINEDGGMEKRSTYLWNHPIFNSMREMRESSHV